MPYMTADQIISALDDMEATSPGLCTADSCPNRTVENRDVRFIKISHPSPPAAPRRAVLIVGGLHAREWAPPDALISFGRALLEKAVGPAPEYEPQVVSYAPVVRPDKVPPVRYPRQIVARSAVRSIFENLDIYIAPLINPDGREFSLSEPKDDNQHWRKNRGPVVAGPACIDPFNLNQRVGTDINRNFRVAWKAEDFYDPAYLASGAVFTALDPCGSNGQPGEVYRGDGVESEAETKNVVWLQETRSSAHFFVDVHAYNRSLLYGWGMADNQTDPTQKTQNFQNTGLDRTRKAGPFAGYGEYIPLDTLSRANTMCGRMQSAILRMATADSAAVTADIGLGSEYAVKTSVGLYPASGASTDYVLSLGFQRPLAPPFEATPVPPERHAFTIEAGTLEEREYWPSYVEHFPKIEREIHLALWGLLSYAASPATDETFIWPIATAAI